MDIPRLEKTCFFLLGEKQEGKNSAQDISISLFRIKTFSVRRKSEYQISQFGGNE